jgi:hypothetical protein
VRVHDGPLDLVCTRQRILKILKITGLTEVFGIYETVDQAIAATKGRRQGTRVAAEFGAEAAPDQVDAERFAEWFGWRCGRPVSRTYA